MTLCKIITKKVRTPLLGSQQTPDFYPSSTLTQLSLLLIEKVVDVLRLKMSCFINFMLFLTLQEQLTKDLQLRQCSTCRQHLMTTYNYLINTIISKNSLSPFQHIVLSSFPYITSDQDLGSWFGFFGTCQLPSARFLLASSIKLFPSTQHLSLSIGFLSN